MSIVKYAAIDTETELIEDGVPFPRIVCMSWATEDGSGVVQGPDIGRKFRTLAKSHTIVGHNFSFDALCLKPYVWEELWELYEAERVVDTQILATMHAIAEGRLLEGMGTASFLGLKALAKLVNIDLDKGDVRTSFRAGQKLSAEQTEYARKDAEATLAVWKMLSAHPVPKDFRDQVYTDFVLSCMRARGLRVDVERVEGHISELEGSMREIKPRLMSKGLIAETWTLKKHKWEKKRDELAAKGLKITQAAAREHFRDEICEVSYSKDTRALQELVKQRFPEAPKTKKGISTEAWVLRKAGGFDDLLEFRRKEKLLSTYFYNLRCERVHPRFHVLVNTGRTSSSQPNVQNVPRGGGVRECFIPTEGHIFVGADYSMMELRCLADICFMWFRKSVMRDLFMSGQDIHQNVADDFGCSRQEAKVVNFGLPGGLQVRSLVSYAENSWGVLLTEERAEELRDAWFGKFGEIRDYFAKVRADVRKGRGVITHYGSQRRRKIYQYEGGGYQMSAAYNSHFQGLGADAIKEAMRIINWECLRGNGVLKGSRIVSMIHDELLLEVPKGKETEAATVLVALMETAAKRHVMSVPVKAEAYVSERWKK